MWKDFSQSNKETKDDDSDRVKPENCIGQKCGRLSCEDASVCRHNKNHVFFLVSSNKILKGTSLASDCLIHVCVTTVFAKLTYTPLKRCVL